MEQVNDSMNNSDLPMLVESVSKWHHDRNLVEGANNFSQFTKLIEEAGELAGNLSRGKCCRDDIGDMLVVLINICEREGYALEDCLYTAWLDIKDRKGRLINGTFVKESDL